MKFQQARQARTLNLLMQSNHPLTSQYLASYFNISPRLIRYDIHFLKKIAIDYNCTIHSIRGSGYVIDGNFIHLQKEIKKELGELYYYDHIDTKDSFIREQLILRYLLFQNKQVTTKELIEKFYITRATLNKDITRAKETIEPYHMQIQMIPYKGIQLLGTEINKRMLLARETAFYKESPLIGFIQKELSFIHLPMKDLINFVYQYFNISLSHIEAYNLYVHVWIMFYRIWQNIYVLPKNINDKQLFQPYFQNAQLFFNRYISWIHVPEEEYNYFIILVLSSGTYYDVSFLDDCQKMVTELKEETHVSFSQNFVYDLVSFLSPVIIKSRYQISSNSIMIREIKKKKPLSIDLAYRLSLKISQLYKIDLFDNDICALAYLIENGGYFVPKNKKAILTTSIGYFLSQSLIHLLKEQFCDIHFLYVELYEIPDYDFSDYDFIISDTFIETSHLNAQFIKIHLMCTNDDIRTISSFLQKNHLKTTQKIFSELEPIEINSPNEFLSMISKKYSIQKEWLLQREFKITFETNKHCVIICDYSQKHQSHGWYCQKGIYWKNAIIHYFFYINIFSTKPFYYLDIENYLYQYHIQNNKAILNH